MYPCQELLDSLLASLQEAEKAAALGVVSGSGSSELEDEDTLEVETSSEHVHTSHPHHDHHDGHHHHDHQHQEATTEAHSAEEKDNDGHSGHLHGEHTTHGHVHKPETTTQGHEHKNETAHNHNHDTTTTEAHTETSTKHSHSTQGHLHTEHSQSHVDHTATDSPTTTTITATAVFEPFLVKMSTVVVASSNPLQGGKAIVNKHIVNSPGVVKTSGQARTPSRFFNSVLYTDTQPHGGGVTRLSAYVIGDYWLEANQYNGNYNDIDDFFGHSQVTDCSGRKQRQKRRPCMPNTPTDFLSLYQVGLDHNTLFALKLHIQD